MRVRLLVPISLITVIVAVVPWNGLKASPGCQSVVEGASSNTADIAADCATVSGGKDNSVTGSFSTIGGGTTNKVPGGSATVGGGYFNNAGGGWSTVGGGSSNSAGEYYATVAGGGYNIASGNSSTVGGGASNLASGSSATVSGGYANRASGDNATVAGGNYNEASAAYATISGGGRTDDEISGTANRVTDSYGTVGGGGNNQAGDNTGPSTDRTFATVSGGQANTASGAYSNIAGGRNNTASGSFATIGGGNQNNSSTNYATVSGGYTNSASNLYATTAGGRSNTASGQYANVAGGFSNLASGSYATVAGGLSNTAQGSYSYAAGRRAKATTSGSFVWGDGTDADIAPTANNQFIARASGGVTFFSNATATSGVNLPAGGGAWSNLSDRNVKANLSAVNTADILERVAAMPVQVWNYTSQDASVKHIGPMAQDFAAAFGVGEDNKHISTVDADGVALAAIQGLYQENQELKSRLARVEAVQGAERSSLHVVSTGLVLNWGIVVLAVLALIVLLIVSTISLTLLFLRRHTTPV